MKSLLALVFTALILLAQRGSCQSVTNDPRSLQGLHQISSVSVTITQMTDGTGTRLLPFDPSGKVGRDLEGLIKGKLIASHIAVVDSPQMTPDSGHLSVSIVLMSFQPNRYSFTAFCHLDQQMTLVRTGASSYANTYEGQAYGAMPNDANYLHGIVRDLASGFVRSYMVANTGLPKSSNIPATPRATLQDDYKRYKAAYSAPDSTPAR